MIENIKIMTCPETNDQTHFHLKTQGFTLYWNGPTLIKPVL